MTQQPLSFIIGTGLAMRAPGDGYTEKFAEFIPSESAKFSKIIKATGAKVD